MYHLPVDSPNYKQKDREKTVFFEDEAEVLNYIKYENVTRLMGYQDENKLDDALLMRFINYSINMIKPASFKSLCIRHPELVPHDVMKKVFHAVNCEYQDSITTKDRLDYLSVSAYKIAEFLSEFKLLNDDDIGDAMDIYIEYKLDDVLGDVELLLKSVTTTHTPSAGPPAGPLVPLVYRTKAD